MENKANYALIGAFVLIALFGMMAFFAYLSGKQFDQEYNEYLVVYDTPPRGISVGSEVRFSGIKVGEVIETELNFDNPNEVLVHIRLKAGTPVMQDTYGQNEPLGLTGLSYIQLFAGESTVPLVPTSNKDLPRIGGRGSQIDQLLGGSESVIDNINIALSRAVNVLDDEAITDFHGILDNLNTVTKSVADSEISAERVERFLAAIEQAALDVSVASLSVDQTAQDISQFLASEDINTILTRTEEALTAAKTTLMDFSELSEKGGQLTDESIRAVEQFSSTGLNDLSAAMAELKELIITLNRVSEDLQRNPSAFIVGQEKEITELPQ